MSNLLHVLLEPFNVTAFTAFGVGTSWGEVAGFVSGALCVWLVARQNIWNWPIGIANNGFFLLLFVATGLYADSALQVVYIVLAGYGWWVWLRGGARRNDLPVTRTTAAEWKWLAACGVLATALLTVLLGEFTDSTVPFFDAATTALSLIATWGQCYKKVESWWLWIAADVVYVPLYGYKHLWLTALLYVGFMVLCVVGLIEWRRAVSVTGVRERRPKVAVSP